MGSKAASLLSSIWIPEGYLDLSTQMYTLLLHTLFLVCGRPCFLVPSCRRVNSLVKSLNISTIFSTCMPHSYSKKLGQSTCRIQHRDWLNDCIHSSSTLLLELIAKLYTIPFACFAMDITSEVSLYSCESFHGAVDELQGIVCSFEVSPTHNVIPHRTLSHSILIKELSTLLFLLLLACKLQISIPLWLALKVWSAGDVCLHSSWIWHWVFLTSGCYLYGCHSWLLDGLLVVNWQ